MRTSPTRRVHQNTEKLAIAQQVATLNSIASIEEIHSAITLREYLILLFFRNSTNLVVSLSDPGRETRISGQLFKQIGRLPCNSYLTIYAKNSSNDLRKSLITKVSLSISISKEIRTAK